MFDVPLTGLRPVTTTPAGGVANAHGLLAGQSGIVTLPSVPGVTRTKESTRVTVTGLAATTTAGVAAARPAAAARSPPNPSQRRTRSGRLSPARASTLPPAAARPETARSTKPVV